MKEPNYTLLCDYYELTMGNGYFEAGMADQITYFDIFFRQVPDHGGFAIAAGLEQGDLLRRIFVLLKALPVQRGCLGSARGDANFSRRADPDRARPSH